MADQIEAMRRKQAERMEEFRALGLKPQKGGYLGAVEFSATETAKLLRMLKAKGVGRMFPPGTN